MTNYLIYATGEFPLILAAPHSGELKPVTMPSRKEGKVKKDSYTDEIIQKLIGHFSKKPYYIYANIHRSKVDLNRDVEEATEGNPEAISIWNQWNTIITEFSKETVDKFGTAFYVDIHSHAQNDKFQLGYELNSNEYLTLEETKIIPDTCSLDAFNYDKYEMIFGEFSINAQIRKCGYDIFTPDRKTIYFNGGTNVWKFSTKDVGAVQIEIPVELCRKGTDEISECIGNAITVFMENFVKY